MSLNTLDTEPRDCLSSSSFSPSSSSSSSASSPLNDPHFPRKKRKKTHSSPSKRRTTQVATSLSLVSHSILDAPLLLRNRPILITVSPLDRSHCNAGRYRKACRISRVHSPDFPRRASRPVQAIAGTRAPLHAMHAAATLEIHPRFCATWPAKVGSKLRNNVTRHHRCLCARRRDVAIARVKRGYRVGGCAIARTMRVIDAAVTLWSIASRGKG